MCSFQKTHCMKDRRFYFRGHANTTWEIKPSICRDESEKHHEAAILREQIRMGNWNMDDNLFENIARLQHYGVHTRMLDYSLDADIAIYFACESNIDIDGIIYICPYDCRETNHLHTAIITELAILEEPVLVSCLTDKIFSNYEEYVNQYFQYTPAYDPFESVALSILSIADHGIMVTPSSDDYERMRVTNPRLYNQKGAFFVFGNKTDPYDQQANTSNIFTTKILPSIAEAPRTITIEDRVPRVIVRKEDKREILEELSHTKGITRSYIYPDE